MKRVFGSMLALALSGWAQTITVTKPAADETWFIGTTYSIEWTRQGPMGDQVRIVLGDPELTSLIHVIADPAPNTGSFQWQVPVGTPEGDYRIRVRVSNIRISGDSASFRIKPGPGQDLRALEARLRLPPKLSSFRINDGAEQTEKPKVILNHKRMVGGTPSHFRVRGKGRTNAVWSEWMPYAEAPPYDLRSRYGEQTLSLQLKNEYGESNVLEDSIIYNLRAVHAVDVCAAISEYCKDPRWVFGVTKKDCDTCARMHCPSGVHGDYRLEVGEMPAGSTPRGHTAEFELFGGRELNEGWEFVSFTYAAPSGDGVGSRFVQYPAPGSRNIRLVVSVWHEISRFLDGADFKLGTIHLKGPCDRPVAAAFK